VDIEVEVRPLDPVTFYATEVGNPDIVQQNGYGIVLATRTADFPTPASFLVPLVDGRSVRSVGNTNFARLNDPEVSTLVDEARAGREDGWRSVAQAALETSAYVPLAETRIRLLAGQRLRNGVVMRPYASYDVVTAGVR